MSEAIVVAIITGVCAIAAELLIAKQSNKELYAKLDKESELSDARLDAKLEKHQAVTDVKIEALAEEVRKHNNYTQRVPLLEEKVARLEQYHKVN